MNRFLFSNLLKWKDDRDKKPLLVRGARQVGKTYLVRQLAKKFPHFLEINFEMEAGPARFFSNSLDPGPIVEKLSFYYDMPIVSGETLLFFDEIQSCPEALRALRFFQEKMPGLHVIAAGSLLEFSLSKIPSFGVGRIESLFLYPMTFFEFLEAVGEGRLVKLILESSPAKPVDPVLHEKILGLYRVHQIIGGLPESVKQYAEGRDLRRCQKVLDDLVLALTDDFAKYKERVSVEKLAEVFRSAALQSGSKFVYTRIAAERSAAYKSALDLLVGAGLVYKVIHTSARGLPLGAQIDDRRFKAAVFDPGIYQRLSGLDLRDFLVSDADDLVNRGSLAELSVCAAFAASAPSNRKPELYYWHRERRASNAEVDYICALGGRIVPVEVKSGSKGAMQSLHLFLKERDLDLGIRLSAENFARYGPILVVPLYAAERLTEVVEGIE